MLRTMNGIVSAMVALCLVLAVSAPAGAQTDPLPSWNDGPAKQAILEFVRITTDTASPKFVAPEARIAAFDQDGTTWVEQPMYTQVMFAFHQLGVLAEKDPKLKEVEPFKTVLSGDRAAMAKLTIQDLEKILAVTHTGMTVEAFQTIVQDWIAKAKHPRFQRPFTELVYQPMLEVMQHLRASGYKTYFVTGGGQDFVRAYAERVYGVPPEQVVGSAADTKFGYDKSGKAILTKVPKLLLVDDNSRRRQARVRLRPEVEGRHLPRLADGRGPKTGLDRHQHEERLEAHLRIRITSANRAESPASASLGRTRALFEESQRHRDVHRDAGGERRLVQEHSR
jgi:phosphoglycolate phosphatase-like HAD superfamily hydrolase